jgi:HSP20 family protein
MNSDNPAHRTEFKAPATLQKPLAMLLYYEFRRIKHNIRTGEPDMEFVKIRFADPLDRFGSQFEKTIENIFRPRPVNPMFACKDCSWYPQMDMYETEKSVIIMAELAGVEKDDLEVEINSKAVRIHGVRKELPKDPAGAYRLAEIRYGRFERILYLPTPVDTEVISSTFSNGLLSIQMAKIEMHKTHKIPISDG